MFGFWNWNQWRGGPPRNPEMQNLQEIIHHLQDQNLQLGRANEILQSEISTARQKVEKLNAQCSVANHDLCHERAKNEELGERMASLRQMLVPPPEVQVSDSEVVQRFTALRSLIFRLVKATWAKGLKDNISERELSDEQHQFFGGSYGNNAQWKSLHNYLRYFIFLRLHRSTLSGRQYALRHDCKTFDRRLGSIETWMWDNLPEGNTAPLPPKRTFTQYMYFYANLSVGSRGQVMDWRIATMKITEYFREDSRSTTRDTQHNIWNFLSPIKTNGPEAEGEGKADARADLQRCYGPEYLDAEGQGPSLCRQYVWRSREAHV